MSCIGEPISWLRLERYRLGELSPGELVGVERHLNDCGVCRACLARVDEPLGLPALRELRAVPGVSPSDELAAQRRKRTRAAVIALASAAALAAAALLMLPFGPGLVPPTARPARLTVKGGELAIELVRLAADGGMREPSRFAEGDRFKVLLTCPASLAGFVDVVMYQDNQAFFPLPAGRLDSCGNRRSLPGAFTLSGKTDVIVCAVLTETAAVSRNNLARGPTALPPTSVCTQLLPAPAAR